MSTLEERFWAKVDKTTADGCWLWTRSCRHGYGAFWLSDGILASAHRIAWMLTRGSIPDELCVLHSCDVRACCNPAHLWLGTAADNMRDMVEKGRSASISGENNGRAILSESQVIEIRRLHKAREMGVSELARYFGVSTSNVEYILQGVTWPHLK